MGDFTYPVDEYPYRVGRLATGTSSASSTCRPSPPCGRQVGGGVNPPCTPPPSSANLSTQRLVVRGTHPSFGVPDTPAWSSAFAAD
ncbi:hypothetical protein RHA1_ro05460 [Rhodococcus jostii RHA1]|uniref:Uncharacterized protein n=1 Tax=Rhodococcus jostii (strain RHA1) TaxID=101510 RepID=Q0S5E6_RHOJR|nr:hypothetical protein RHA1_ro05460 [Rhodococcus jostii RHA1]